MQHGINIKEYFSLVARRKWNFIIPLVIVVSVSAIFTMMLPKIYVSYASFLVKTVGTSPLGGITNRMDRKSFKSLQALLTSRNKIEEVIKKLGLEQSAGGPEAYEALVKKIRGGISVSMRGSKISVSFKGPDPRLAMQITNTFCGFFMDQDLNLIFGGKRSSAIPALQELADYYERRVTTARGVLAKFELENKGKLQSSQSADFKKIELAQLELAKTEVAIKEEIEKKRIMEEQLSGGGVGLSEFYFIQKELTPAEIELKKLYAEQDSLLTRYTPKHPEIIRIKNKAENLKRKILASYSEKGTELDDSEAVNTEQISLSPQYKKFRKILNNTILKLKKLRKRKEKLPEIIQELHEHVRLAPRNQQEYAALKRDLNVNDKIYRALLVKIEKAHLAQEISTMEKSSRFTVLSPAGLPLTPIAPNMSKNLIIATIVGIIIGTSFAVWAELSDHSLRDLADAKKFLSIPILSTIPTVGTAEEAAKKRRINMFITVLGTFYGIFIIMLIVRELITTYAPNLLYLQTYKEWFYQFSEVFR